MASASLTSATMDELVARVNCTCVGAWLNQLLSDLGLTLATPAVSPGTMPRSAGLVLRIELLKSPPLSGDARDAFYISRVEGDETVPPPLGLDRASETIDTALAKLSPSIVSGSAAKIAAGDRRVSFFMDGGRVIELRFNSSLVGFDRIVIARLGAPLDWRNPSNR